jgi:hypothetical protein
VGTNDSTGRAPPKPGAWSSRGLATGRAHVFRRHSRIPVLIDDPLLGYPVEMDVKVKYADGATEALETDKYGVVLVAPDHGPWADLEFTTELREHRARVFIDVKDAALDEGVWRRLVNLGYVTDPEAPAAPPSDDALMAIVESFRADHGIEPVGDLDDRTREAVELSYRAATPWGKRERPAPPGAEDRPWVSKGERS